MKRIINILLFLMLFNTSFSLEPFLELITDYRLQNYEESYLYYRGIGGIKHRSDFYYTEISIIGEEGSDPELDLFRGYIEVFHEDYSLAVGRQTLNWGVGYMFNLASVFDIKEFIDPKSEKSGTDSAIFKYSSPSMARFELAWFNSDISHKNFASRYTFLIDDFEFMGNYFYTKQFFHESRKVEENNKVVLEVKGDIGIGIWGQLGYDDFQSKDYITTVLGADYNFELLNRYIYTIIETEYNEYISGLFLSYNFSPTENTNFQQGYSIINDDWFITNAITYTYNDYLEFQFLYNYFHQNGVQKIKTNNNKQKLENEVTLRAILYL
ncbi:MAG: hypothetical protein KAH04_04690 [Psychrilyobacter sp.]|nr:hypothetical protein [Psychrilyobacter sp.]